MIDEAFLSFQHIIERMLSMDSEFIDHELGIRSYIYAYEIETPLELDIVLSLIHIFYSLFRQTLRNPIHHRHGLRRRSWPLGRPSAKHYGRNHPHSDPRSDPS